ncbi:DNA-binding transcriptional regulator RstA [Klebsiella pneumoniae subsp. ozaenae]|uniref:DNA-binding transcriptional regulator RstA n=1 Tax=Klebsiella pneumoniae subsp. ozaenae TaxID=574 RepID=A0A378B3I9_KLEPO|nr:DNA-binding transcriptional regulator RstA [Klebsiella pneumoniae subsp. ozaenae]
MGRQRLYSENHPASGTSRARLRLHLRQHIAPAGAGSASSTLTPHKTISFGSLTIDPVNRQVLLGGENVALSTADFDLLWELPPTPGRLWTATHC